LSFLDGVQVDRGQTRLPVSGYQMDMLLSVWQQTHKQTGIYAQGRLSSFLYTEFLMNQQPKASRHFNLQPVTARHLENVASWYQNIDELALIESNLPLPVSAKSLETLWQRDLQCSG
jgi:hypothetical protein